MKLLKAKRPRVFKCKYCRVQMRTFVLMDGVRCCHTCNQIFNKTQNSKYFQLDIFGNLNPIH